MQYKIQKYYQVEEEIRRQMDSYQAIDRSELFRGPVRDRSNESSGGRGIVDSYDIRTDERIHAKY